MPNKPAPPSTALEKFAGFTAAVLFIVFVVWLANGVAAGGWVRWFAIALVLAPIAGLFAFYAWIAIAAVLQARRNVREAQQWQREHPEGLPPERPRPKAPVRKRRRRSRGNR